MRIIKDYLDDSILKSLVLPRAKSLFNKSDNIKVCYSGPVCMDCFSKADNIISFQTTPSPRVGQPNFPLCNNVISKSFLQMCFYIYHCLDNRDIEFFNLNGMTFKLLN